MTQRTEVVRSDHLVVTLRPAPAEIRSWGRFDTLLYNFMAMNVVVMLPLPLLAAAAFYARADLFWAIIIAGCFCCAEAIVYAILASTFPKSGGDYYFQSRLLSRPAAAVMGLAALVIGEALWMAIAVWVAATVAVGPLLVILGDLAGSDVVWFLGVEVQSGAGMLVLGLFVIVWSTLVNLRGLRVYARLQRWFWVAGAGLAGVIAVLALVVGRDALGSSALYVEAAAAEGTSLELAGGTVAATIAAVPVAAFSLIYPGWSVQQGSEVRDATRLRGQLLTILGAEAITVLLSGLVVVVFADLLRRDLWVASARLFFSDRDALPYPTAPFYWFFDGRLWPSGVAALLLALLCNAWFWMWVTDITLAASRVLARIAADRALPSWIGDVYPRSRAPGNAVLAFHGMCLVPLVLFAFTDAWRLAFAATIVSALAFAVTCSAMAVLPFTNRELYRSSTGAAYQVWRVPLVTIFGAAFAFFCAFLLLRFSVDDSLALGGSRVALLAWVGISYLLPLAFWLSYRRLQQRRAQREVEITFRTRE